MPEGSAPTKLWSVRRMARKSICVPWTAHYSFCVRWTAHNINCGPQRAYMGETL